MTWDGTSWIAQDNDGYESNTDDQTATEVNYANQTSGLSATTVQEAIDEFVTSELPSTANTNEVLTWNGTAWVAQVNDGYEPNTDEQNAALVPMIPPSDYNNDNTIEENVKDALDAINSKIGSSNNVWVNSQEPGYENDFFTNENNVKYGIGTNKPDRKLHVDGDVLVKNSTFLQK